MVKLNIVYVQICIIFILLCFPKVASSEYIPLKSSSIASIKLSTGTKYSPFIDTALPDGGWSLAIVNAVFKELNISISLDTYTWPRVLHYTNIRESDAAFPYIATMQREKDFYFSEPINIVPVKIVARKNLNIKTIKDLRSYILCLPYGYELPASLINIVKPRNINHATTTSGCLKKVNNGWSDLVLLNQYAQNIKLSMDSDLEWLSIDIPTEKLHLIASKKHPHGAKIIKLFNQGLRIIKSNRTLEKINKQYSSLLALD